MKKAAKVSDLTYPVGVVNNKIGISQSLMNVAMTCDYKLLFELNRYNKTGSEENFFFGDCCHELLDIVYTNHHMPPTKKELEEYLSDYLLYKENKNELFWLKKEKQEYYETIITITMYQYFLFYADDFELTFYEVEKIFNVRYKQFMLTGKKDGKIRWEPNNLLFEHKTKTFIQEDTIEELLEFDFQVFYYILADYIEHGEWLDGVLYNVIRKTKMYKGKKETLQEFGERFQITIQRDPEHFFKRFEATYTTKQYKEFQKELDIHLADITKLIEGKRKPVKRFSSCNPAFPCPFIKACASGTMAGYTKRKHISPELN